ncbi:MULTISPECIES: helix-turn-helix domain-containing protein [unclassified Paenibacillus]|uniref:helix-turn-helix domain-containing protein n=1 Tax=unclassified Paenibacillus TaxID=185978 RepID=UPI00363203F8
MSKYLFRLLSFSLILGLIPVIGIGFISYFISSKDIENKVKEGNMQIMLQTQMRVEQVLKAIELSVVQYSNSALVTQSVKDGLTPDDFPRINELSRGLYNLQSSGIRDAHLINIDKDWMINYRGFRSFSSFPYRDLFLSYMNHPDFIRWITDNLNSPAALVDTDPAALGTATSSSIGMVLRFPLVSNTMLVIEIMKSELQELLTQNTKLGEIYVLDGRGNNFLVEENANKYQDINSQIVNIVSATNQASGFFNSHSTNNKVGVTYRVSPYNGWIYVSVVSIEEITKESRKIALITLSTCIIIFGIVIILAFYGSRRMYSPIRRLFQSMKDIEDGERTAGEEKKDEFVLMEERFRSLSNTGKQLQQQMKGQFTQLKEFFVIKLFTGQISESDFAYRCRIYGFPVDWKTLGVLTLQIDTLQGTRYPEHDRELLLFAIHNIVGDLIPQNQRFSPIILDQSQITLLTSELENSDELKDYYHQTAELIQSKVNEFLQLQVSIGISSPFVKYTNAIQAYEESLEALKCRISLGNEIIVHFEDISTDGDVPANVYSHFTFFEDQLVQAIKTGDEEKGYEVFQSYITAIVDQNVSFTEYQMLMLQLISRIVLQVRAQGITGGQLLGEHVLVDKFMKLNTLDEIIYWFRNHLIGPVARHVRQQAESQYVNIADEAVKIIHDRFDKGLTLESCAAILNFHPVYLSRVFKKKIGTNFSDYLSEYRINMAKSWLESSDMKIAEISERLNYSNTTAFIRMFRKLVGLTPKQYREQFTKE